MSFMKLVEMLMKEACDDPEASENRHMRTWLMVSHFCSNCSQSSLTTIIIQPSVCHLTSTSLSQTIKDLSFLYNLLHLIILCGYRDYEICMFFTYGSAAYLQALQAGPVNQGAGGSTSRIFEDTAGIFRV